MIFEMYVCTRLYIISSFLKLTYMYVKSMYVCVYNITLILTRVQ